MSEHAEPVAPSAGHRERKRARLRASLRDAALALFSEHGFERTTVEEIASAADVVPRTFFRYFHSKDDVLFNGLENVRELWRDALRRRPRGEGALQAIMAAMRDVLAFHADQERTVVAVHQLCEASAELRMRHAASRYEAQVQMSRVLAERLEASDGVVASLVTAVAMAATWTAIDRWIADGPVRPLGHYAEAISAHDVAVFRAIDERYRLR